MNRRDLLFAMATAVASGWPAVAQEVPKKARIGLMTTGTSFPRRYFDEAMVRLGWVEGKNLTVDWRITGADPEARAQAARELVAARLDAIVAGGIGEARPLRAVSDTVPIVVVAGADLIQSGLAQSLARPGGNVTGNTVIQQELDGKRLQLLHELLPAARRMAIIVASGAPALHERLEAAAALAQSFGVTLVPRSVSFGGGVADIDAAVAASAREKDDAMFLQLNPVLSENRRHVIDLIARNRLPAMYEIRDFVVDGGLLSYGPVIRDYFERAAALTDKILRGARPADIPIEQPTRFELVVNLNTANALGLTIPRSILALADEVIE